MRKKRSLKGARRMTPVKRTVKKKRANRKRRTGGKYRGNTTRNISRKRTHRKRNSRAPKKGGAENDDLEKIRTDAFRKFIAAPAHYGVNDTFLRMVDNMDGCLTEEEARTLLTKMVQIKKDNGTIKDLTKSDEFQNFENSVEPTRRKKWWEQALHLFGIPYDEDQAGS